MRYDIVFRVVFWAGLTILYFIIASLSNKYAGRLTRTAIVINEGHSFIGITRKFFRKIFPSDKADKEFEDFLSQEGDIIKKENEGYTLEIGMFIKKYIGIFSKINLLMGSLAMLAAIATVIELLN